MSKKKITERQKHEANGMIRPFTVALDNDRVVVRAGGLDEAIERAKTGDVVDVTTDPVSRDEFGEQSNEETE